jgi:SAM-dependent methyltransferase
MSATITGDARVHFHPNRRVAAIFDDAATVYDATSNAYTMARRVEALVPFVSGMSLEVGGGTAAVTCALDDASRAIHSDISPQMCGIASAKAGCRSVCFDAETIPVADASIDTVISSEMIYYLAQPERFATEAHRVLSSGGRLLISTTNPAATLIERGRSLLRKLGFQNMFFDDGSPSFLSMRRIVSMLEEAGFAVEQKRHIVVLPFAFLDWANRILERTPLKHFGLFMIVVARKK